MNKNDPRKIRKSFGLKLTKIDIAKNFNLGGFGIFNFHF